MSKHQHDNIYSILGKLAAINAKDQVATTPVQSTKAKSRLVESMDTVEAKLLREFHERDELAGRTGMQRANKFPRSGQTDMSNIPAGNLPNSKNPTTSSDRSGAKGNLKASLKRSQGKYAAPNLPEGGDMGFNANGDDDLNEIDAVSGGYGDWRGGAEKAAKIGPTGASGQRTFSSREDAQAFADERGGGKMKVLDPRVTASGKFEVSMMESATPGKKFGVFQQGGSVGDKKDDKPSKTFDTKEEASEYAKRRNKGLSAGEKGYYKIKYVVRPITEAASPSGELKRLRSELADAKRRDDKEDIDHFQQKIRMAERKAKKALAEAEYVPSLTDKTTGHYRAGPTQSKGTMHKGKAYGGASQSDEPEDDEFDAPKLGRGRPKKADSERASASAPFANTGGFPSFGKEVSIPKGRATSHSVSDAPPKGSPEYAEYAEKQARTAKRKGKIKEAEYAPSLTDKTTGHYRANQDYSKGQVVKGRAYGGASQSDEPESDDFDAPKLGRGRPKKADSERASAALPFSATGGIPKFGKEINMPKISAGKRHSVSDAPPKGSPEYAEYAEKQARVNARKDRASKKAPALSEQMQLISRRLTEGLNFKAMAEATHQNIDELMSELQQDISNYKSTGHCSEKLRDFLDVHSHGKKQVADEAIGDTSRAGHLYSPPRTPTLAANPSVAVGSDGHSRLGAPQAKQTRDPIEHELNELARLAGLPSTVDEDDDLNSEEDFSWDPVGKAHAADYNPDHDIEEDSDEDRDDDERYDRGTRRNFGESGMSEVDALMQDLGTGEADIYTVMNNPSNPVEKAASHMLQQMYDDVVSDTHLHPDDDFEQIIDIMADRIAADHPSADLDEEAVDFDNPSDEPINNAHRNKYSSMKQSTMNPGEGDNGEKKMFPGNPMTGDNRMAKQPMLEARLAAEYESIKKVVEGADKASEKAKEKAAASKKADDKDAKDAAARRNRVIRRTTGNR